MHNILMLGSQGSGKGTQSVRLAKHLDIPTISVGNLFRTEIDKGTGLGEEIQAAMSKGDRVDAEIVDQLMRGRLNEDDCANGMILDGYPRTFAQKDVLDGIFSARGQQLTHVIFLNISDEEAVQRLSGRWVCSNTKCERNYHITFNPPKEQGICDVCGHTLIQREDDKPDAIRHRLDLYHKDTQPLIEHYKERGILHEIDGARPIADVEAAINTALGISA